MHISVVVDPMLLFNYRSPVDNEVYVDPVNGSDSNPGTESKPVKSIETALTLLRTVPKGQAKTMYLRSAYYHLASTINFGPEDSGLSILPWDSNKKDEVRKKRYVLQSYAQAQFLNVYYHFWVFK